MKRLFVFIIVSVLATEGRAQPKLGWSLSPEGFPITFNNIFSYFHEVDSLCDGSMAYASAAWRDSLNGSGQLPIAQSFTCQQQPAYGYTEMVTFGWATYAANVYFLDSPNNTAVNDWSNPQMRSEFLQMLATFASTYHPRYLFVGNEVDFYMEYRPADYANWASFYNQAYDTVKAHSPATKMGTVISYDHIAGCAASVGWTTSYWNALDQLDSARIDVLGLTLYPFFNAATANAVPLTYLDSLYQHWGNKPFSVVETGWPADSLQATPWMCSEQQQIDYINRFFTMTAGQNLESVNWIFLHYNQQHASPEEKVFCSIAMYDSLGNPRQQVLNAWLAHCPGPLAVPEASENNALSAAPNPFSDATTITFPESLNENCLVQLFDALGREVYRDEISAATHITIPRGNLPPGLYLCCIRPATGTSRTIHLLAR